MTMSAITNRIFCVTALLLVVSLPLSASAYFTGEAASDANSFGVGTLDISVDDSAHAVTITSSSNESFSFTTASIGSVEPQYRLVSTPVTCSSAFYNGINVEVTQGGVVYSGGLNALLATSSVAGLWSVVVTASSLVATNGEQCTVDLSMQAWQNNFPLWNTMGFTDEVVMSLVITAGEAIGPQVTTNVVLNEIYPNPDTATTTVPLEREWLELYNGTGSSVDVLGWKVNEHSVVATCTGGANEMQPYAGASTNMNSGGLLVIEFCNNGGQNKLTNSGMLLELFDTGLVLRDSYSYPSTVQLKSHARIPDGGTWVDPIPSPGVTNMSTVTEGDLLAEGWSEELIVSVLGPKSVTKQDDKQFDFISDTTGPQMSVGTSTATSSTSVASSSQKVSDSVAGNTMLVSSSVEVETIATTSTNSKIIEETPVTNNEKAEIKEVAIPVTKEEEPEETEAPETQPVNKPDDIPVVAEESKDVVTTPSES